MTGTLEQTKNISGQWLGQPIFDFAGAQLTPFMLVRTVVIVVAIFFLVRMARKLLDKACQEHPDLTQSNAWVAGKLAKWGIIVFGGFLALSSLGIDLSRATLIMSALTVGIGFGLQNIVNNFVSGLILMFERSVRVGDWIEVGTTQGIVKQLNMRSTVITTFDRAEIIVPNSDLISRHVTNWTLLDSTGRIVLTMELVPDEDPDKVCAILTEQALAHADVCNGPNPSAPVARINNIGLRGVSYTLQCFVDDIMIASRVRGELLGSITRRFSQDGVKFAFTNSTTQSAQSESRAT